MAIEAGLLGFLAGGAKGASDIYGMKIENNMTLQRELSLLDIKNRYAQEQTRAKAQAMINNPLIQSELEAMGLTPEQGVNAMISGLWEPDLDEIPEVKGSRSAREALAERISKGESGLTDQELVDSQRQSFADYYGGTSGRIAARRDHGLPIDERGGSPIVRLKNKITGDTETKFRDDPETARLLDIRDEQGKQVWTESRDSDFIKIEDSAGNPMYHDRTTGETFRPTERGLVLASEASESLDPAPKSQTPATDLGFRALIPAEIRDYDQIGYGVGPFDALAGMASNIPAIGQGLQFLQKLSEDVGVDASFGERQRAAAKAHQFLDNAVRRFFTIADARPGVWDQQLAQKMKNAWGAIATEDASIADLQELLTIMGSSMDRAQRFMEEHSTDLSRERRQEILEQIFSMEGLMAPMESLYASRLVSETKIRGRRVSSLNRNQVEAAFNYYRSNPGILQNPDHKDYLNPRERTALELWRRKFNVR